MLYVVFRLVVSSSGDRDNVTGDKFVGDKWRNFSLVTKLFPGEFFIDNEVLYLICMKCIKKVLDLFAEIGRNFPQNKPTNISAAI